MGWPCGPMGWGGGAGHAFSPGILIIIANRLHFVRLWCYRYSFLFNCSLIVPVSPGFEQTEAVNRWYRQTDRRMYSRSRAGCNADGEVRVTTECVIFCDIWPIKHRPRGLMAFSGSPLFSSLLWSTSSDYRRNDFYPTSVLSVINSFHFMKSW